MTTKPSLFDLGPTCGSSDVADVTRTNTSTSTISTLTTMTGVVSIVGYDVICCMSLGEGMVMCNHPVVPCLNPVKLIGHRSTPGMIGVSRAHLRTAS